MTIQAGDRIPDVLLDWRDSLEGDVVGYTVYRSDTPGGPYDFAGFVGFADPPPPSTFTDGCLFGDSFCVLETCTMHYVVTATDELLHEGPYSNEASVRLDCEPRDLLVPHQGDVPSGPDFTVRDGELGHMTLATERVDDREVLRRARARWQVPRDHERERRDRVQRDR